MKHGFMTTTGMRIPALALALVLAASACQDEDPAVPDDTAAVAMPGMPGMPGMGRDATAGGMQGGMMARMQAHMRMMDGVGADSLKAMVPMHRQMAANMIAQMNREMRDMDMAGDAAWTATVDSLRRDLVRMPELSAGELPAFMAGHRGRLMRLMEMHGEMMADMEM